MRPVTLGSVMVWVLASFVACSSDEAASNNEGGVSGESGAGGGGSGGAGGGGGATSTAPTTARGLAQKLGHDHFLIGMGNDLNNDHNKDGAYTLGVSVDVHYAYLVTKYFAAPSPLP